MFITNSDIPVTNLWIQQTDINVVYIEVNNEKIEHIIK